MVIPQRHEPDMVSNALSVVDPQAFLEALEKARSGQDVPIVPLMRTIAMEAWLRHIGSRGILVGLNEPVATRHDMLEAGRVLS
jgi:hypothetical protein